jgi:hypothetical protein
MVSKRKHIYDGMLSMYNKQRKLIDNLSVLIDEGDLNKIYLLLKASIYCCGEEGVREGLCFSGINYAKHELAYLRKKNEQLKAELDNTTYDESDIINSI